jgi:peptidoglycan hydrolase-like protein with peptidoglycan-binding domain
MIMRRILLGCAALLFIIGCNGRSAETRAREAAEKIKESIPDVEARALAQTTTPEQVKQAQEALQKVHEYLGEATGKLDAVTVNSIEAFQRAHGLRADGILNERTQRALQEAAAKAG